LRKLLWLEWYCNCRNEKNVDSTFERKYSKYKIMYRKFIPKMLKMYQTFIALSTYIIFYHSKMLKFRCKFRIDNFSIVMTSKRRFFEELSGILLVPQKRLVECLPKIYFFIIYYNLYLKSKAVGWSYIPSTALTKEKKYILV